MNLNTLKSNEKLDYNRFAQLSFIFGFKPEDFEDIENLPEMNFFEFLEFTYNKLLLQGTLYNETQPFVSFLNDIVSDEYLSSYSYNSLSVKHGVHTQVESAFKDFCVKLLMDAESETQKTIHSSKGAVNNVFNEVQVVSRGEALFFGFQRFVESKYHSSVLDVDDICSEVCYFHEHNKNYEQLLNISQYGQFNFLETANYLYSTGVAYYFLGKNYAAKQNFTEFLLHSPGDVDAIGFLMIIELQEFGENVSGNQRGFERIIKKVEELNQEFPPEVNYNILYAGAVSNYNLGNFEEAAKLFEKVLEIDPKDDRNFSSLVESYERSGQFQKALDLLLSRQKEYGNDEEFQKGVERLRNKINQK